MQVTIVSFVRGRSDFEEAEAEFVRRMSAHTRVAHETVKSWSDTTTLPKNLERGHVVGLCIDGKVFDSEGLADHIGRLQQQGRSHLVFVIGAADGMPAGVEQQLQEQTTPQHQEHWRLLQEQHLEHLMSLFLLMHWMRLTKQQL